MCPKGGCGEVEAVSSERIVVPLRGTFCYHFSSRREVTADVNTALVLAPQQPFKISHPFDSGDRCVTFQFTDASVRAGVLTLDPQAALASQSRSSGNSAVQNRLVERAKVIIAADPFADRSLGEIAAEIGASPYHLTRSFRRVTGRPLHAYRLQLRLIWGLERAQDGESLTDVALDCGFSSHSHFTQAFRRHFNCVPSALRKISTAR